MHPCVGVMPSACRKIKSTRGNPGPQSKGAPKGAPREAFASLNVPVELASQFDEKHIDSLPPVNENLLQRAPCAAKKGPRQGRGQFDREECEDRPGLSSHFKCDSKWLTRSIKPKIGVNPGVRGQDT